MQSRNIPHKFCSWVSHTHTYFVASCGHVILTQESTVEGPGLNHTPQCSALLSLWCCQAPLWLGVPITRERLKMCGRHGWSPALVGWGDGFVRSEDSATWILSDEGSELLCFLPLWVSAWGFSAICWTWESLLHQLCAQCWWCKICLLM